MGPFFFFAILLIFLAAVVTQQGFIFTILYLLVSIYLISIIWTNRVNRKLEFKREFTPRAFPGEKVKVNLQLKNCSSLPLVYARLHETMPAGVSLRIFEQVTTLKPNKVTDLYYEIFANKRGFYPLGPLTISTGDLMGFSHEKKMVWESSPLIVYPQIYSLAELGLPSHAPLGTMKYHQPVYEDLTRAVGKRDYQPGDSTRRIDWKSSAVSGKLQVRQYEAAIILETAIFLDVNIESYGTIRKFDSIELAVSTAASLANWVILQRQRAGLFTNSADPSHQEQGTEMLPPGKDKTHLMRILEILAGVQPSQGESIASLINRKRIDLSWGATIVLITGSINSETFNTLLQARHAGLSIVVILCGEVSNLKELRSKAKLLGFVFYHLLHVIDLKELGINQ
jgi:uncharacterized protein (DUF58 family)